MTNKTNDEWAALVMKQVDDIYRLETSLASAQSHIDRLTLELASRQPLADSYFSASPSSPVFPVLPKKFPKMREWISSVGRFEVTTRPDMTAIKAQLGATEVTHHPATETSRSQIRVNFDHMPEPDPKKSFDNLLAWLDASRRELRIVTTDEYARSPELWRQHADEQRRKAAEDERLIDALRGYAATQGEHTAAMLEAAAKRIEELLERDE